MTSTAELSLPFPKSIQRAVASLGHVVDRFIAARVGVLRRCVKVGNDAALRPWLPSEAPVSLSGEGLFAVRLMTDEKTLRLREWLVDVPEATPQTNSLPALSIPAEARLPVWPALFKLRMLRGSWELEMRSNLLQSLDAVLPASCLLDASPLPPGSVIGGLGLHSWDQIVALRDAGRSFQIHTLGRTPKTLTPDDDEIDWNGAIKEALAAFPHEASVMTEITPLKGGREFTAVYKRSADRIDLHSVIEPL